MPGSTPPTSQLDWLISTTAMIVLSWSRATRDLLKSFGWGIRALHQLVTATMVPFPRRQPHTISPLEGDGFEPSVPHTKQPFWLPAGAERLAAVYPIGEVSVAVRHGGGIAVSGIERLPIHRAVDDHIVLRRYSNW